MNIKVYKLTILLLLVTTSIKTQSIYLSDNIGVVYKLDIQTCEVDSITESLRFTDISFDNQGQLIGIVNNSLKIIDTLTGVSCPSIHFLENGAMNCLTISDQNIHYAGIVGGEIFSYNPFLDEEKNFYKVSELLSGDITFRNNYMLTASINDVITKININDTTDVCELNFGNIEGKINGLSSTWHNCQLKTFAAVATDSVSKIYELKFHELDTIPLCEVNFSVYGSCFRNEYLTSLDSLELINLCSTSSNLNESEYKQTSIVYPNPTNSNVNIITNRNRGLLCNFRGVIIEEFTMSEGTHTIKLDDYPNGMYILKIGSESFKIIKQ